ncbi:protein lifeguard 1 [Drosophila santomea]|uniref:protein lifeguard 1 n=1 Tax=Drosophila santomea TaxID=129105 RepID=UPI00195422C2|nr:protein lifeguard 1 [Drosophila santomea]
MCLSNEPREPMHFESARSRRMFITKVLMIVAINLLITMLIMTAVIFNEGARQFFKKYWYIGIIGAGVILLISIIMCLCHPVFRIFPCNYILLLIYVLAHAAMVCCAAVRYHPKLVFIAVGSCAGIMVFLCLFARFAPCDFSGCGIFAFVISLVVLFLGIVAIFYPSVRIVYVALGVLMFCLYMVIDIQMIIGGKTHENQFKEEDYIIAAMALYTDIIFLFLYLLDLIGLIGDD